MALAKFKTEARSVRAALSIAAERVAKSVESILGSDRPTDITFCKFKLLPD